MSPQSQANLQKRASQAKRMAESRLSFQPWDEAVANYATVSTIVTRRVRRVQRVI